MSDLGQHLPSESVERARVLYRTRRHSGIGRGEFTNELRRVCARGVPDHPQQGEQHGRGMTRGKRRELGYGIFGEIKLRRDVAPYRAPRVIKGEPLSLLVKCRFAANCSGLSSDSPGQDDAGSRHSLKHLSEPPEQAVEIEGVARSKRRRLEMIYPEDHLLQSGKLLERRHCASERITARRPIAQRLFQTVDAEQFTKFDPLCLDRGGHQHSHLQSGEGGGAEMGSGNSLGKEKGGVPATCCPIQVELDHRSPWSRWSDCLPNGLRLTHFRLTEDSEDAMALPCFRDPVYFLGATQLERPANPVDIFA